MTHNKPDPDRLTKLDQGVARVRDLRGVDVISTDGTRLGTIIDLALRTDGQIEAVIIETGGLLGVGARRVAVDLDELDLLIDAYDKPYLRVHQSKADLEKLETYRREHQSQSETLDESSGR